jgi:hypothetical protein
MPVTTDAAVASHILSRNPLAGPIILDYVTADSWSPDINTLCFNQGKVDFPYKETGLTSAARNYWRLVTRYLNPTHGEIYGWVRDLIRHTIAIDELFYKGNKEDHILLDVSEVCTALQRMGPKVIQKADYSQLESTYAEAVGYGKREAMKVILAAIKKDADRVNMASVGVDLLDILRRAVTEMWYDTIFKLYKEGDDDKLDFGVSDRYRVAFANDVYGDEDSNQWLQYPALIDARGLHLTDSRQEFPVLDLTNLDQKTMAGDRDPDYTIIMATCFYSNVDGDLLERATMEFVDERTFEGEFMDWNQFHNRMPHRLYHDVPIEDVNYAHLQETLQGVLAAPQEPTAIPHVESGVAAAPAVKEKEKESGTLTLIVFAAVIGILFMQS